jgi:hypothetical protein
MIRAAPAGDPNSEQTINLLMIAASGKKIV